MNRTPHSMILHPGLKIEFGITDFGEELPPEVAAWAGYLEYRIGAPGDVLGIPIDRWCIAHAPDPQEDGWLECVDALSRHPAVRIVNTHARPDDEYTLCGSCKRRMVNTQHPKQSCDWCSEGLGDRQLGDGLAANNFETVISTLREGARILAAGGKQLVVENTYEPPDLMCRILDALPQGVGFTLDVGHALINWACPLDYVTRLRHRLAHLHLHDNMGGNTEHHHDKHLPPGAGIAPWTEIGRALRRVEFSGTATFECKPSPIWLAKWQGELVLEEK